MTVTALAVTTVTNTTLLITPPRKSEPGPDSRQMQTGLSAPAGDTSSSGSTQTFLIHATICLSSHHSLKPGVAGLVLSRRGMSQGHVPQEMDSHIHTTRGQEGHRKHRHTAGKPASPPRPHRPDKYNFPEDKALCLCPQRLKQGLAHS